MDTEQRRDLRFEVLRGRDIGRDHAFLDQLVRIVMRGHDALDLALRPVFDLRFPWVSKSIAPRRSRAQHAVQRVQTFEIRHEGGEPARKASSRSTSIAATAS